MELIKNVDFAPANKSFRNKKINFGGYYLFPKVKNIYYSYHVTNFLFGLLQHQKNLNLKYVYFYTKFLHKVAKAMEALGLISSVKITFKNKEKITKKKFDSLHNIFQYNLFLKVGKQKIIKKVKNMSFDRPNINLYLKYVNEKPLIHTIKIYSRPGRRLYVNKKKLEKLSFSNSGSIIFLSNSYYGIIDNLKALKLGVGGMLLYKVN